MERGLTVQHNGTPYTKLERRGIHEAVAQQISEHVASWRLGAGDALPGERRLSQMLGVSRGMVREALRELAARGMVRVRHGRRTVITADPSRPLRRSIARLSTTDDQIVLHLFEVRGPFEAEMAALAAERVSDGELEELARLVARMKELPAGGADLRAFVDLDLAFHATLARSTHNPVFTKVLESIRELLVKSRCREILLKPSVSCIQDHERIYEAVRRHDPGRARRAMLRHIHAVRRAFSEAIERRGEGRNGRPGHGKEVNGP